MACTAWLAGCGDDVTIPDTLAGNGEKTPIEVSALLDAGGTVAKTRAADMRFDTNDELLAYVRHVTWNGSDGERTSVVADDAPRLVTFISNGVMDTYNDGDVIPIGLGYALGLTKDNTQKAAMLKVKEGDKELDAIYWDDFSNSATDATDLRTDGHYLQSYYGYCYNGSPAVGETGSCITTALTEKTGTLGWTIQTDQTQTNAFLHSDLLWSAEQTPVAYAHVDAQGKKNHGTLTLPYTHAMSKVTINITLGEGFDASSDLTNFASTLHGMFTTCTCTAPTYKLSSKGNAANVIMKKDGTATYKFEAIVVPSVLTIGNNLATLTNVDNNTYTIPVTPAMVKTATQEDNTGWGAQLTEADENIQNGTAQAKPRTRATIEQGKGYEMKSGVNYVLNVTLNKQGITVSALIKDWVDVEAEGTGIIKFDNDVTTEREIAEALKAGGFDVYKSSSNSAFATKNTTLTWNTTDSKWEYTPAIYWGGQGDASYFRALSPTATTTAMTQGNDVLWGTSGSDAITPRTGDVPLDFEHAMTKVTVNLETATEDAAKVDFDGATLKFTNLSTSGTITLTNGGITPGSSVEAAFTTTHTATNSAVTSLKIVDGVCFIPQTIADNAKLQLTLKDGTTYSLQLNKCQVATTDAEGNPTTTDLTTWARGNHYTYTIHVEKVQITFRALIKDWVESNGSGNATLDWD